MHRLTLKGAPTSRSTTPRLQRLTVIVPLAPGDESWPGLQTLVPHLPAGSELIFAGPRAPKGQCGQCGIGTHVRISWVQVGGGRAQQMNCAAKLASRSYLWFVHADSIFGVEAVDRLLDSLSEGPDDLHWFDLKFRSDGPPLMALTTLGVAVRSRWLGIPFGDQALCLSRQEFFDLGGFEEGLAYGEDHILIWAARRAGVRLRRVGAPVWTSARRYREKGWMRTTARHLVLTAKQAVPQAGRHLLGR